jgi:hypothetical protein
VVEEDSGSVGDGNYHNICLMSLSSSLFKTNDGGRGAERRGVGMVDATGEEAEGGVRNVDGNCSYLDTRIMHRAQSSSLIVTVVRVVYTNDPSGKRPTHPGPLASSIHLAYTQVKEI